MRHLGKNYNYYHNHLYTEFLHNNKLRDSVDTYKLSQLLVSVSEL